MFRGRPWPVPGEPLFLPEDTAAALALAEEESDTCSQCGMPKAWCRDNEAGRARFDIHEEFCWATYRVGQRRQTGEWQQREPAQREAYMLSARFRPGKEPSITAGLGIDQDGDGLG